MFSLQKKNVTTLISHSNKMPQPSNLFYMCKRTMFTRLREAAIIAPKIGSKFTGEGQKCHMAVLRRCTLKKKKLNAWDADNKLAPDNREFVNNARLAEKKSQGHPWICIDNKNGTITIIANETHGTHVNGEPTIDVDPKAQIGNFLYVWNQSLIVGNPLIKMGPVILEDGAPAELKVRIN